MPTGAVSLAAARVGGLNNRIGNGIFGRGLLGLGGLGLGLGRGFDDFFED